MYYENIEDVLYRLRKLNYWDSVITIPREKSYKSRKDIIKHLDLGVGFSYQKRTTFNYNDADKFFGEFTILPNNAEIERPQLFKDQIIQLKELRTVVDEMFAYGYDWTWYKYKSTQTYYENTCNLFVGAMLKYKFEEKEVEHQFVDEAYYTIKELTEINISPYWLCLLSYDIQELYPEYMTYDNLEL